MTIVPNDLMHDEIGFVTEYTSADAPQAFHNMLQFCSGIKRSMWFYWWHAQWVAFFVRFNPRTRRLLDYLRRQKLKLLRPGGFATGDVVRYWNPESRRYDRLGEIRTVLAEQWGDLPSGSIRLQPLDGSSKQWIRSEHVCFAVIREEALEPLDSLPPGSVAVHVRHGDKFIEVKQLPFKRYLEETERLAAGDQDILVLEPALASSSRTFAFPEEAFASRVMFISTEDPDVIFEAMALARQKQKPWTVAFTQENRSNDILMDMVMRKGAGKATLESLLNLELALEADAWVCTLQSNWCQLVDELRMTIAGKASFPYINLRTDLVAAFKEIRNSYVYW